MIKIELRRISCNQRLSDETHCYTADLYVDGQRWGVVSNRGCGGSDDFAGTGGRNYGDLMDLDKRIAAEYPPTDLTGVGCPGETMPESLESLCANLVSEHLIAKDMQRALTRSVLFLKAAEPGIFELKPKRGASFETSKFVAAVKAKYPDARILNEMPTDEALALYRKAG